MIDDVIRMVKELMQEAPELKEGFFSEDRKIREKARMEIVYRLQLIDDAMARASEELKTPRLEVWKLVYDPKHYKPEEFKQLQEWLQILHQQNAALFRKRRRKKLY